MGKARGLLELFLKIVEGVDMLAVPTQVDQWYPGDGLLLAAATCFGVCFLEQLAKRRHTLCERWDA